MAAQVALVRERRADRAHDGARADVGDEALDGFPQRLGARRLERLVLVGGALKLFPTVVRLGRGQVGVQHLMRKFISLAVSLVISLAVSLKKVITELVSGRLASMHMVAFGRRIWIES